MSQAKAGMKDGKVSGGLGDKMWCFNNERKVDNSSTPDMFLGRLFHKPKEAGKKRTSKGLFGSEWG